MKGYFLLITETKLFCQIENKLTYMLYWTHYCNISETYITT